MFDWIKNCETDTSKATKRICMPGDEVLGYNMAVQLPTKIYSCEAIMPLK